MIKFLYAWICVTCERISAGVLKDTSLALSFPNDTFYSPLELGLVQLYSGD